MDSVRDIHGLRVLVCEPDGPPLARESDANTLLSAAWEKQAAMIALPVERIDPAFFRLSTRLAGEVMQKFVNYNMRFAVVGDISAMTAASKPLHDFVYESNLGRMAWFVNDLDALAQRLATQ